MKTCTRCRKSKSQSDFSRRPDRGENALRSWCKQCHREFRQTQRSVFSPEEKAAALEVARQWKRDNRARVKAYKKAYEAAHPEQTAAHNRRRSAKWRAANPELARQRVLASVRKKPEERKSRNAAYAKANPAKCRAKFKRYQTTKMRACPAWANHFFIEEAYELAQLRSKLTGVPHHVDHVVPPQSPLVCGLHVEHNLAVIPKLANLSKANRHWPGMP
jgi:hypothetical protein